MAFFLLVGGLGMLARFLVAAFSIGCDDAYGWKEHADFVLEHGVRYAYEHRPYYNHPPLMGYWSALAARLSDGDMGQFSLLLKLPGLSSELVSAWIVHRIWQRGGALVAAQAFAAYALSIPAILVSGYHGNTDSAYAGLTLLAAFLLHARRRPFLAGLSLAAALNVKLMPVFLVPAFLAQCRSWRGARNFSFGVALGAIPYLPYLITSHAAMYRNMIAYNSIQDEWGVVAFLHYARHGRFSALAADLTAWFVPAGRNVIALAVLAVSWYARSRRRFSAYDVGALTWALFLVLTPGFGVQYSVCVVPLLFAANVERGIVYSCTAGAFLLILYATKMDGTFPLHGMIQRPPYDPLAVLFGVLAWASLVRFIVDELLGPRRGSSARATFDTCAAPSLE